MTTDQYDRFSYQDNLSHKDVIKWKHFPHYWSFVRGIQWSLVNSLNIETPSRSLWRHCNAVARECCERCIRGIPCAPSSAGCTDLKPPEEYFMELFHQSVTFTGYRMRYYISYTPEDNSHLLYQHSLSMIRAWISNVILDFHLGCNYSSTPLS